MSILCNCPQDAALADIPISECPERFGQLQKVAFQRIFSASGTKNGFALPGTNPNVLASWTPLLAAADGTKVTVSPYINAPVVEAGAAREYGSGNEVLGGIPVIVGKEPSTFTGALLNVSQESIGALKKYQCENVGVYLIDEFGRIGVLVDDREDPTRYEPVPVASFFVGDKVLGGLENPDSNAISWRFYPNWSDNLVFITPTDFNALIDLATPSAGS